MKKLTKKERKKIYLEVALLFATNKAICGMCFNLRELADIYYLESYHPHLANIYKEFELMYPPHQTADSKWGVTDSERVIVMCLCAAMCD